MVIKTKRIKDFLNWCADYEKKSKCNNHGLIKTLLREYLKETKANLEQHFLRKLDEKFLAETIKNLKFPMDVQAKLMCLFSVPIDSDFHKALNKSAKVKLDKKKRISMLKYGKTFIKRRHRAQQSKEKDYTRRTILNRLRNETGWEELEENGDYDDEEAPEILNCLRSKPNENEDTDGRSSTDLILISDPSLEFNPCDLKTAKCECPDNFCSLIKAEPEIPEPSIIISCKQEPTFTSPLEDLLHKLEYFFFNKFRPEFMPLCQRIKEIKENEARLSQKIIHESLIKSFFDVFLRLMVANLSNDILVKGEGNSHEAPLSLIDFLCDLRNQQLSYGIDETLDSMLVEADNKQTINYYTISRAFMEIVNSLAQLC